MNDREFVKRALSIEGLAEQFKVPTEKVFDIYVKFNAKIYKNYYKKNEYKSIYVKELEDKTYDLTERYFQIHKMKKEDK